jgi:hypothetical protein
MSPKCFFCGCDNSAQSVVCDECAREKLHLNPSALRPPYVRANGLSSNLDMEQRMEDDELRDALAHIYHYAPDFRDYIRLAAKNGVRVLWGPTKGQVIGFYLPPTNTITVSDRKRGDSVGSIAALLAHEIYHASQRWQPYSAQWRAEEVTATVLELEVVNKKQSDQDEPC